VTKIIVCNFKEEEFVITLEMVPQIVMFAGKMVLLDSPIFIIVKSVNMICVVVVL
jgi:hypothetical protein